MAVIWLNIIVNILYFYTRHFASHDLRIWIFNSIDLSMKIIVKWATITLRIGFWMIEFN